MILGRTTINGVDILEVDDDPSLNGAVAPVGSMALVNTTGFCYMKRGAGDREWERIVTEGNVPTSGDLGIRTYGNVMGMWEGYPYPIMDSDLISRIALKRGNIDLVTNTSAYSRCMWKVEVSDPSSVIATYDGLTFTNTQEIVDWINSNVPNDGGTFLNSAYIHAYDRVSPAVNPLPKIFGRNRTFSRMRPADRYWSPSNPTLASRNWNALVASNFLSQLWQDVWGSPFPTPVGSWSDADFACFWTPSDYKNLYRLPNPQFSVNLSAGQGGRHMLSGGNAISADPVPWFRDTNISPVYAASDATSTSYRSFGISAAFKELPRAYQNGESVIIAFPMSDGNGNQSVYIKPVGTDVYTTSFFDQGQYQLEAVGTYEQTGQVKIRPIFPQMGTPLPSLNVGIRFGLDQLLVPLAAPNMSALRGNHYKPGKIRFQIRNLANNQVSPFLNPTIQWDFRVRFRPLAALVKNDPTR